jgi:DnaJ-domain-containing protein 1
MEKMKDLSYLDHSTKKQNIDFFVHLVRIALADDIVSKNEMELLHEIGTKLGFSDHKIDYMIATTDKSDYIPSYELSERFEQVFEIVKMMLVDGLIDKNAMRLASGFAIKSGFIENEIPRLLVLLISGIKEGKDEEELFEAFRKGRRAA